MTGKDMTIKEYIEKDMPFYHITRASPKESILKCGLLSNRCNCNAICSVRSDAKIVWDNIIATQIPGGIRKSFLVIKLIPSKHGIGVDNVAEDSVDEPTKPLHNYIADIPSIKIDESDIVCDDYHVVKSPGPVPEEMIESLDGYTRKPIPDMPILPD
jgi:hypothetical protein